MPIYSRDCTQTREAAEIADGGIKKCKRCLAAFDPIDRDRDVCIQCYQQQKADAAYQKAAFGKEFK